MISLGRFRRRKRDSSNRGVAVTPWRAAAQTREHVSLRSRRCDASEAEFALVAPAPRKGGWTLAASCLGIPWVLATLSGSFWYLGWGSPDGWFLRVLIWVVVMGMMAAVHALALLSLWGAVYSRIGTETLTVDPDKITVSRRAGRFPVNIHIRRGLVESARLLPAPEGRSAQPRIEIKSWRSAIRFGAGLTEQQAAECVEQLNDLFARAAESGRGALTLERRER